MRLETQLAIVQEAFPLLPGNISFAGSNNMHVATGKVLLRRALELLKQLPYFAEEASTLLTFGTFALFNDEIALNPQDGSRFAGLIPPLHLKAAMALDILKLAAPAPPRHTVVVRLPPFDG